MGLLGRIPQSFLLQVQCSVQRQLRRPYQALMCSSKMRGSGRLELPDHALPSARVRELAVILHDFHLQVYVQVLAILANTGRDGTGRVGTGRDGTGPLFLMDFCFYRFVIALLSLPLLLLHFFTCCMYITFVSSL